MSPLRRTIVFLAVTFALCFSVQAHAQISAERDALLKQHIYFEYSVAMLAFIEMAKGNSKFSECVLQEYFNSPISTIVTVNRMWREEKLWTSSSRPIELATIIIFKSFCKGEIKVLKRDAESWADAKSSDVVIEEATMAPTAIAGFRMLGLHADYHDDKEATKCIAAGIRSGALYGMIEGMSDLKTGNLIVPLYQATREACDYPRNGPNGHDVKFPLNLDFVTTAEERVRTARHSVSCDTMKTEQDLRKTCHVSYVFSRIKAVSRTRQQKIDELLRKK